MLNFGLLGINKINLQDFCQNFLQRKLLESKTRTTEGLKDELEGLFQLEEFIQKLRAEEESISVLNDSLSLIKSGLNCFSGFSGFEAGQFCQFCNAFVQILSHAFLHQNLGKITSELIEEYSITLERKIGFSIDHLVQKNDVYLQKPIPLEEEKLKQKNLTTEVGVMLKNKLNALVILFKEDQSQLMEQESIVEAMCMALIAKTLINFREENTNRYVSQLEEMSEILEHLQLGSSMIDILSALKDSLQTKKQLVRLGEQATVQVGDRYKSRKKPKKRESVSQRHLIHAIRNGFQNSAAQFISYRRKDDSSIQAKSQSLLHVLNKEHIGPEEIGTEDGCDDSTRNSLSCKYLSYKSRANFFRYTDEGQKGLRFVPHNTMLDLNKYQSQGSESTIALDSLHLKKTYGKPPAVLIENQTLQSQHATLVSSEQKRTHQSRQHVEEKIQPIDLVKPIQDRLIFDNIQRFGNFSGINSELANSSSPLKDTLLVKKSSEKRHPLISDFIQKTIGTGSRTRFQQKIRPFSAIQRRSDLKDPSNSLGKFQKRNQAQVQTQTTTPDDTARTSIRNTQIDTSQPVDTIALRKFIHNSKYREYDFPESMYSTADKTLKMKDHVFDWMNIKYGIERADAIGVKYKKPEIKNADLVSKRPKQERDQAKAIPNSAALKSRLQYAIEQKEERQLQSELRREKIRQERRKRKNDQHNKFLSLYKKVKNLQQSSTAEKNVSKPSKLSFTGLQKADLNLETQQNSHGSSASVRQLSKKNSQIGVDGKNQFDGPDKFHQNSRAGSVKTTSGPDISPILPQKNFRFEANSHEQLITPTKPDDQQSLKTGNSSRKDSHRQKLQFSDKKNSEKASISASSKISSRKNPNQTQNPEQKSFENRSRTSSLKNHDNTYTAAQSRLTKLKVEVVDEVDDSFISDQQQFDPLDRDGQNDEKILQMGTNQNSGSNPRYSLASQQIRGINDSYFQTGIDSFWSHQPLQENQQNPGGKFPSNMEKPKNHTLSQFSKTQQKNDDKTKGTLSRQRQHKQLENEDRVSAHKISNFSKNQPLKVKDHEQGFAQASSESSGSEGSILSISSQTEIPQITIQYDSGSGTQNQKYTLAGNTGSKDSVKSGSKSHSKSGSKLNKTINKLKAAHALLKDNSSFYKKQSRVISQVNLGEFNSGLNRSSLRERRTSLVVNESPEQFRRWKKDGFVPQDEEAEVSKTQTSNSSESVVGSSLKSESQYLHDLETRQGQLNATNRLANIPANVDPKDVSFLPPGNVKYSDRIKSLYSFQDLEQMKNSLKTPTFQTKVCN